MRLPADVETALYRIVQEALTNVGQARGREPRQRRRDAQVDKRAGDDRGRRRRLRPQRRLDGVGLGLLGMRERVELLDGTFEIDSRRRVPGTTLIVELPLV